MTRPPLSNSSNLKFRSFTDNNYTVLGKFYPSPRGEGLHEFFDGIFQKNNFLLYSSSASSYFVSDLLIKLFISLKKTNSLEKNIILNHLNNTFEDFKKDKNFTENSKTNYFNFCLLNFDLFKKTCEGYFIGHNHLIIDNQLHIVQKKMDKDFIFESKVFSLNFNPSCTIFYMSSGLIDNLKKLNLEDLISQNLLNIKDDIELNELFKKFNSKFQDNEMKFISDGIFMGIRIH